MADQPLVVKEMAFRRIFQFLFDVAVSVACLYFTWPLVTVLVEWSQSGAWHGDHLTTESALLQGLVLLLGIPFMLGSARIFAFELLPYWLASASRPAPEKPWRSRR